MSASLLFPSVVDVEVSSSTCDEDDVGSKAPERAVAVCTKVKMWDASVSAGVGGFRVEGDCDGEVSSASSVGGIDSLGRSVVLLLLSAGPAADVLVLLLLTGAVASNPVLWMMEPSLRLRMRVDWTPGREVRWERRAETWDGMDCEGGCCKSERWWC